MRHQNSKIQARDLALRHNTPSFHQTRSSRAEAALDSRVLFAIGLERVAHAGTYYPSLSILVEFLPFYAEIRDSHTTIESGLQYLIFPDPVQIFRSIARPNTKSD